jgi:hypothetical protein
MGLEYFLTELLKFSGTLRYPYEICKKLSNFLIADYGKLGPQQLKYPANIPPNKKTYLAYPAILKKVPRRF